MASVRSLSSWSDRLSEQCLIQTELRGLCKGVESLGVRSLRGYIFRNHQLVYVFVMFIMGLNIPRLFKYIECLDQRGQIWVICRLGGSSTYISPYFGARNLNTGYVKLQKGLSYIVQKWTEKRGNFGSPRFIHSFNGEALTFKTWRISHMSILIIEVVAWEERCLRLWRCLRKSDGSCWKDEGL